MSGFSADWLALRGPFDEAARARAARSLGWPAFAARLHAQAADTVRVMDLGCGCGASLMAVAPQLGGRQHWRLVDHDAQLLAVLPDVLRAWAQRQGGRVSGQGNTLQIEVGTLQLEVEWQQADLSDPGALSLARSHLVTASALLDLVSEDWLATLVTRCAAERAAVCWALSVDGRVAWEPADPADALVEALFARDQRTDKGFGPALGGSAPAVALARLQRAGYRCASARSDWQAAGDQGPAHRALLRAMVEGAAHAAQVQAADGAQQQAVGAWAARRLAQCADPAGALRLAVGHLDLLAWPDGD